MRLQSSCPHCSVGAAQAAELLLTVDGWGRGKLLLYCGSSAPPHMDRVKTVTKPGDRNLHFVQRLCFPHCKHMQMKSKHANCFYVNNIFNISLCFQI